MIIMIVGESGSGKTTLAEYFMELGVPMIRSYTDRPKRNENDTDHTFLTPEEFDRINPEDILGYTKFGDYRYCCKHSDVSGVCTYVISEDAVSHIKNKYRHLYDVVVIRVKRPAALRLITVGAERVGRDAGNFSLPDSAFDYIIDAINLEELREKWEIVAGQILSQKIGEN